MLRSMFAAVSGLRNHQIFLDVVGNNIANINTAGFKASRVTFQDILSQSLRGASSPQDDRGGTNPIQVGLGAVLAGTDLELTQGNLNATGKSTDMSIQGNGMFVLSDGSQTLFTRAGAFDVDSRGRLVSPASGLLVQGWRATDGVVDTNGALQSIRIPLGEEFIASPTAGVTMGGNLNAAAATGATVQSTLGVYDAQGNRHDVTFTFTKSATVNQWTWAVASSSGAVTTVTPSPVGGTAFAFTGEGQFDKTANDPNWWDETNDEPNATLTLAFNNGAPDLVTSIDLSKLTQLAQTGESASSNGEVMCTQGGSPMGSLSSFSIGPNGDIVGVYSNGLNRTIAQLAVATFPNPAGLSRVGSTAFNASASSGEPRIGAPNSGDRGSIASGFLEQSNVDLAKQFTDLIMAERGFQANSRVITASDEMLQDLVNLKR